VIRAERRDALRDALERAGVATQIYYPVPLHLQPCFAGLAYREGAFPEAERAARECLALPIFPELDDRRVEHVVATIASFYR
jgi:dTDP-4-amino-4,6-dideoxygalactose transaminase